MKGLHNILAVNYNQTSKKKNFIALKRGLLFFLLPIKMTSIPSLTFESEVWVDFYINIEKEKHTFVIE